MKNKKPSERIFIDLRREPMLPAYFKYNDYYETFVRCFNCNFGDYSEHRFLIKKGKRVNELKCPVCECKTLI